jgi:hypothetical protein
MNRDKEAAFVDNIRQQLERHAEVLDDITLARLAAARKKALTRTVRAPGRWLPLTGLAAAAAVLLAVLLVHQLRLPDTGWEVLMAQDDIELIEDLDFYAWLEATQPNS